ncbi:DUF6779 domain-containing protein [Skermania piniformis]|uniref:DUF6779 domain-containing protein n=1 Tax=Skermania pinensis TaxID=39122 RepID=A0ABX8S9I0_9ACTN|nr:DUF6779 domain-containing protein [Skermania piniformis]QXQ13639.1 hypothetical protein KV203_17825 [Skermania piniformis]
MGVSARIGKLRPPASLVVGVIVALGVAASAVLVFSQSAQMLRIGVVVGLWSAVLGVFAMVRYRRESLADRAKLADLQQVYELELDREIAARREFENRLRGGAAAAELGHPDIAALRAELTSLRSNLEALFGGGLPVERLALRAQLTRVQELTSTAFQNFQPSASGLLVPDGTPPAPQFAPEVTDRPQFANPDDEPLTVETAVVSETAVVGNVAAVSNTAVSNAAVVSLESGSLVLPVGVSATGWTEWWGIGAGPATNGAKPAMPAEPPPPAEPAEPETPAAETAETETPDTKAPDTEAPDSETDTDGPDAGASATELASIGLDSPRRRRRIDADESTAEADGSHTEGLSVAQILANLQAERAGA